MTRSFISRESLTGLVLGGAVLLAGCIGNNLFPDPPVQREDSAPSWSPDGKTIAFIHYNPDYKDTSAPSGVYVTDLAGNATLVVASPAARAVDWSPEGRLLVYNDQAGLHVVKTSGDSLVTIYSGGSFPSWSPDGTVIAFSTRESVWGIAPDGSGLRRMTPEGTIAVDPDWSPDGRQLVVLGNPGSPGEEVMIFSVAEGSLTRITTDDHEERSPAWSPRGDRIAWNPWPTDFQSRTRPEIWTMDPLGNNRRFLGYAEGAPTWNPEGSRLVVPAQTSSGPRLFIVNADGTGRVQLTH